MTKRKWPLTTHLENYFTFNTKFLCDALKIIYVFFVLHHCLKYNAIQIITTVVVLGFAFTQFFFNFRTKESKNSPFESKYYSIT